MNGLFINYWSAYLLALLLNALVRKVQYCTANGLLHAIIFLQGNLCISICQLLLSWLA